MKFIKNAEKDINYIINESSTGVEHRHRDKL